MEEKKQLKDALKEKEQAAAQENTENENLDEYGDIRIADEVICIVASLAAQEVPGVVSMKIGRAHV